MNSYIVMQESIADCGACCLLSIIKYYKGFVPLEIIKNDSLTTKDGTTFYNLKMAAIKYGFDVQGFNTKDIKDKKMPLIAQLKINNGLYHFVVVYSIKDEVLCMDPSKGLVKIELDEFNKLFTGNILLFSPVHSIISYRKNNYLRHLLINNINKNKRYLIPIFVISLIILIIYLLSNYNINRAYGNEAVIWHFVLVLIFLKNSLDYLKEVLLAQLNKKISNNLISNYINHFFSLPFKILQLKTPGEILSRINDLNQIKELLTKELINIIVSFISLITIVIVLSFICFKITIIISILSIMYLVIIYLFGKKNKKIYNAALDSESSYYNTLIEYINKILVIKNLNKEEYFFKKIKKELDNHLNDRFKVDNYNNKVRLLTNLFNDLSFILIIIYLINYNKNNLLIYVIFYNYYIELINYFKVIIQNISYILSITNKINNMFYLEPENKNKGAVFRNQDLIISNISCSFGIKQIINNVNLRINKGNKMLLIGPNGSGKSTLLNMIIRNIDNYRGTIAIGSNIKNYSLQSLKSNIIYCSQYDTLFEDTILNNIILDQKYDEEKLERISKILLMDEIIEKKEYGYDTLIKNNLSGGEMQRIIIARCLYQNYKIILFDESFSNIGFDIRNRIIKNINSYYKDKTIIYVSHNQESNAYDKVISLIDRKD